MKPKSCLDSIYTKIYTILVWRWFKTMIAKLFENGRSQAVRLPKEYRFEGDEVVINKIGGVVFLMPKDHKWAGMLQSLSLFSEDFMEEGREQEKEQEREMF